eukprot:9354338-Heterocapsa_arctica.AAC.1
MPLLAAGQNNKDVVFHKNEQTLNKSLRKQVRDQSHDKLVEDVEDIQPEGIEDGENEALYTNQLMPEIMEAAQEQHKLVE